MIDCLYFSLALLTLIVAILLPILTLLLFLWAEQKKQEGYWKYSIGVHRILGEDPAKGKRGLKRLFVKFLDWWY